MSGRRARSKLSFEKRTEVVFQCSSRFFFFVSRLWHRADFSVISFYCNLWRQDLTGKASNKNKQRQNTRPWCRHHMPNTAQRRSVEHSMHSKEPHIGQLWLWQWCINYVQLYWTCWKLWALTGLTNSQNQKKQQRTDLNRLWSRHLMLAACRKALLWDQVSSSHFQHLLAVALIPTRPKAATPFCARRFLPQLVLIAELPRMSK